MKEERAVEPTGMLVYGVPLATVGLATLVILYPGILSPDSTDQWSEARGWTHLEDWHPVLGTLWIRLWSFADTPALPIAVQTLAMAALVAFGCALQRASGVPVWLAASVAALISVWPPTVVFDATLWKDVPYSIAVVTGTGLLYRAWRSPAAGATRGFRLGLAACVFGAAVFRHNGFVAAACLGGAAALLVRSQWRPILGATAIALVCWAGLSWSVKKIAGVAPIPPGYVAIGYLASHVAAGTPLRPDESQLVDAMHPLAGGWPYVCGLTDPDVYDGKFNGRALAQEGWAPVKLVAKLTLQSPGATFRHLVCASRFIWDPTTDHLTGGAIWADASGFRTVPDDPHVAARSPVPRLRGWLLALLLRTEQPGPLQLFWSPALALWVLLLIAGWLALRRRDWGPLIIVLPLLVQTLILVLVVPTPHVRYQYAVILAGWLFVPAFAWLALSHAPDCRKATA